MSAQGKQIKKIKWENNQLALEDIVTSINELIDRLSSLEERVEMLEKLPIRYFNGDKDIMDEIKPADWCQCRGHITLENGVCDYCYKPIQPKEDSKDIREKLEKMAEKYVCPCSYVGKEYEKEKRKFVQTIQDLLKGE